MTMGHRLRSGSARRGIAFISTAALLTSMMAAPAFAEHRENTDVLEAEDAIGAALAWSDATFDSADTVIIGRDDVFADNLASGVLQGLGDGSPLLLTDTAELDEDVAAEIEDLGAENAYVLGGTSAISEDVVEALEDLGLEVTRLAGETRVETAIAVAEEAAPNGTEALLARSTSSGTDETQAFADSLAAGAWAAESGMPVLLTQSNELNDNLAAYLDGSDITSITIVGGTSAVSAAVASELESMGIEVDRVSGATRFETAVAVAAARGFDDAGDADEVILVEGQAQDAWASGFAAAAYSALNAAPIVLSNGADLPAPTVEFLEGGDAALVCGPMVDPAACDEAAELLGHEEATHGNEDFSLTPDEAAVNTVSTNTDPNANRGARTYTITGLDNTKTYDIALVPADEVTENDGTFTFGDDDGGSNNQADDVNNAGGARVETVNGADVTDDDYINNVTPSNGAITFVVDSETANVTVRPVVFQDADNDNQLDLVAPATANSNPKEPSEAFGIGGSKQWVRTQANAGTPTTNDAAIELVNKEQNFFSTADGRFNYDSNDQFRVASTDNGTCVPVSMETFERNLSTNDQLDNTSGATVYSQDPAASSVFCIEDVAPGQVGGVTATAIDEDTIRVAWTDIAGVDSYNIYRTQDTTPGDNCPVANDATYTLVASDTASPYDDNGLTAATKYCYQVAAVDDGDEGARSAVAETAAATTSAPGTTAAPQSTDARLVTSAGFPTEADSGDVWRIIFTEPIQGFANAIIRVQDADGEFENVDCAAEATCAANLSAVTIDGQQYAAGRVLTVTLGTIGAPDGDVNGATGNTNSGVLDYPLTITTQSGITDATGNPWTPIDDPDHTIEDEGTQTVTQIAPTMSSFSADESSDTVTVTFSEPVTCNGNDDGQFTYTDNDTAATPGLVLTCNGTSTVTFTVADTEIQVGDTAPSITYTQSATDANRVKDLDGTNATSPQTNTNGAIVA